MGAATGKSIAALAMASPCEAREIPACAGMTCLRGNDGGDYAGVAEYAYLLPLPAAALGLLFS